MKKLLDAWRPTLAYNKKESSMIISCPFIKNDVFSSKFSLIFRIIVMKIGNEKSTEISLKFVAS